MRGTAVTEFEMFNMFEMFDMFELRIQRQFPFSGVSAIDFLWNFCASFP